MAKDTRKTVDPFDFYDVDFEEQEGTDICKAVIVSKKNHAQRWYVNDILNEMSLKQQAAVIVNCKLYSLMHQVDNIKEEPTIETTEEEAE